MIDRTHSVFTKVIMHFVRWRDWEWNPVLLKELRQAMRSQAVTSASMLLLVGLFGSSVTVLVAQDFSPDASRQIGRNVFEAFLCVLMVASLLFIPLYTFGRLMIERQEAELDLMFITTLPPERIVRGKLLCGAYIAVLFFSVCTPFMTLTTLMRGVDLPTIFFVLICLYGAVCLAIQCAILVGCLPFFKLFKIFVGLLFASGLVFMGAGLLFFLISIVQSGVAAIMDSLMSRLGFGVLIVLLLISIQVLHHMAATLIAGQPPGALSEIVTEGAAG